MFRNTREANVPEFEALYDEIQSASSLADLKHVRQAIAESNFPHSDIKSLNEALKPVEKEIRFRIAKTFGEEIKAKRIGQEKSLAHVAAQIGYSPSYLLRIERGEKIAAKYRIVKELGEMFRVDYQDMLGLVGDADEEIVPSKRNSLEKYAGKIPDKEAEKVADLVEFIVTNKIDPLKVLNIIKMMNNL